MKKILLLFISSTLINSFTSIAQDYGVWREIDSMNIARIGHAMVVLPNGDVLVSGSEADSTQSSAEIYEFSKGKWRYTTPMNIPRALHNLVLLNTGKVLAIGGYKEQSCELYDPKTEIWTMTDSIPTFRYGGQTVTELLDGRIMVAGGYYVDTTTWDLIILNKVDMYDPLTGSWVQATPMQLERTEHTATLLNDGRVLVTGGETYNLTTEQSEIYNPITNTWEFIDNMIEKRSDHAAIRLSNGNVFVSGGRNNEAPVLNSCEVYSLNLNQWFSAPELLVFRTAHRIFYLSKYDQLMIIGGGLVSFGPDTWEMWEPNQLLPIYYESFPINLVLVENNVQLHNENILVSGGGDFYIIPCQCSGHLQKAGYST